MGDLTEVQAAQAIKIIGTDATGLETNPVNSNSSGRLLTQIPSEGTPGATAPTTSGQVAGIDVSGVLRTLLTDNLGRLQTSSTSQGGVFTSVTNTYVSFNGNNPTLLIAANTARRYLYISNNSGSSMNIQFGSSTGLGVNAGLVIPSKTFYEFKGDNLWSGSVYGVCSGNITISVTEGT